MTNMSVISYFRGHKIYWNDKKQDWYYCDNNEKAGFDGTIRPCLLCGKVFEGSNKGDPDPCLGNLPGVKNACCGHGKEGYIHFENGVTIRGVFTIENN